MLSIGIKYITIIFVPLLRKKTVTIILSLLGFFGTVLYMYFKLGIQPWYFLNLAVVLVVVKKFQTGGTILSLGLLLSYYPYIVLGGWDTSYKVVMKEQIIFVTLFTFILSLLIGFFCKNKSFDFFNKLTSGKK